MGRGKRKLEKSSCFQKENSTPIQGNHLLSKIIYIVLYFHRKVNIFIYYICKRDLYSHIDNIRFWTAKMKMTKELCLEKQRLEEKTGANNFIN